MTTDIATADVLEWARAYEGPKFHALLCDPPYHLTNRRIDAPTVRAGGGADWIAAGCRGRGGDKYAGGKGFANTLSTTSAPRTNGHAQPIAAPMLPGLETAP